MSASTRRFALIVHVLLLVLHRAEAEDAWRTWRELPAPEAIQAAAADERFVYAIASHEVAKYDRVTGRRIAISTGEATHLNSGFLWDGKLLCAHSNYPRTPERSEIKVLDPGSMVLSTFREFGDVGGSLTWVVRHDDRWWCNFARYADSNGETFLVQFDDEWRERHRWTYPKMVIDQLGSFSLSGGLWYEHELLVTGHEKPEFYRLGLPQEGSVLEYLGKQSVPFTGQGFAKDSEQGGLVGISRASRRVIFVKQGDDRTSAQIAVPTRGICDHRSTSEARLAEAVTAGIVAGDRLHQTFPAFAADAAHAARHVEPRIMICNMDRQANTLQYVDYCCANEVAKVNALFEAGVEFPLVDRVASNRRIEREDGSIQTRSSNTRSSPELRELQEAPFTGPGEEWLLTTVRGLLNTDSTEEGPSAPLSSILAINEDNSHFFGYKTPEEMNVRGLHAWVDQYAGGAVSHLFICPNAMRASFRSKSRDAIWDPFDGNVPDHPWPRNAKKLHDAGIDPYDIWIARCREKKISPWLSMRMNDVHNTEDRDNFQHSTFWRKNIHLWREPNHEHGSGLNYAHAEVREYQMAFVRELFERYDPDGLELDWMRFPDHLTPGKAREEGRFLTEFMREVRALTDEWSKKRGHRILLGVRAPALPDAGAGTGINAVEWARLGLVDLIVATPFYFSTDFDIPFELWHERLKDAPRPVSVIGGVESTARPWISGTPVGNTMETLRGFAASSYHRGARGVYLFNWMDDTHWPVPTSDYKLLLRDGIGSRVVASGSRRYPVCFHDTVPEGSSRDEQLPADALKGKTFRIHIGPNPKSGRVWAVVGLARRDGLADARFEARLDGQILKAGEDLATTGTFGGDTARAIRFACPLNLVKAGYNELALRQTDGSTGQQIVWVELRVEETGETTP